MPRLPRSALDGEFHHVTGRATGGALLYVDDEDRLRFRTELGSALRVFDLTCHAWCLMGTHYHVLAEGTVQRLSRTMHRLNGRYATWFNERHGRRGRLFADRFASVAVEDESHLHAACWYILQNPVRAGLCGRASDWGWSGLGPPA